jgi:hypothetical protein
VRQNGFSEASFQATLNSCTRKLPTPVIYLEAALGHKAMVKRAITDETPCLFTYEEPPPDLRAVRAVANEAAQAERFMIPQNMRVPESSVIRSLFETDGERDGDGKEDLALWTDSKGKRLEGRVVAVEARRMGDPVIAIVQPVEPVRPKTVKRLEPKSLFVEN